MPTYSYRCRDCGIEFDIQQDFTDESLTTCPECEGALRKLFSAVGVTFHGSGFYRNDARAEAKKAASSSSSSSSSESKGSKSSKGSKASKKKSDKKASPAKKS